MTEPRHEISNNGVCTHGMIRAFPSRLNILWIKLLKQHHLEFLRLKGGCTGSFEVILVKMSYCWKSPVTTHAIMTRKGHNLRPVHGTSRQPVLHLGNSNEIRESNQASGVHVGNAHNA